LGAGAGYYRSPRVKPTERDIVSCMRIRGNPPDPICLWWNSGWVDGVPKVVAVGGSVTVVDRSTRGMQIGMVVQAWIRDVLGPLRLSGKKIVQDIETQLGRGLNMRYAWLYVRDQKVLRKPC